MADEHDDEHDDEAPPAPAPIPKLLVQRMGKKWRIVYAENRNLARFNSGKPVDGGGYLDEYENGAKTVDGQLAAQMEMVRAMDGNAGEDSEAARERVGA